MGSTCDPDPARGGRGPFCPLQECPQAEEEKEPAAGKPKVTSAVHSFQTAVVENGRI